MILEQRIQAFSQLGNHIEQLSTEAFDSLCEQARMENPWFTQANVSMALKGITHYLKPHVLTLWTANYTLNPTTPKTVAVVMAGNIPMVGFHDFLCVLISGHAVQLKLSSKDSKLIQYLIKHLVWLEPRFEHYISVKENKLEDFDAVIATGSDNSARYFEYYFSKYPNIIRKNRTSCSVLTGNESPEDIEALGTDIFSYFGLGCRNVSKIYVPKGYDFSILLSQWDSFKDVIHHHKYCNNYDYQKSILLINAVKFLDNGFILFQESEKLVSPISVLYTEQYSSNSELEKRLKETSERTQCITGKHAVATTTFGQAQFPHVWDYADGIDTLKFLSSLNT